MEAPKRKGKLLIVSEVTLTGRHGETMPLLETKDKEFSLTPTFQSNALYLNDQRCVKQVVMQIRYKDFYQKTQDKWFMYPRYSNSASTCLTFEHYPVTIRIAVYEYDVQPAPGQVCLYGARQDDTLTDVRLVVDGAELPAHRLVLAVRSPVFHKELSETFKEASEARLELKTFSKDAVEKFLEFLYTDKIQDWGSMESVWFELLLLAAKYMVPQLTEASLLHLWSCDCAPLQALALLHAYGVDDSFGGPLRRRLTVIVLNNMNSLQDTFKWLCFKTAYPVLVDSMLVDEQNVDIKQLPTPAGQGVGVGVHLNKMRLEGLLCDVKLVVEGAELPAHLVVLAARSPVLDKMLTGTFKEAKERRIEVKEFSKGAVEKFLEFLYTECVQDCNDFEVELLLLADKYMVPELRSHCEPKVWDYTELKALAVLHDAGLSEVLSPPLRRRLTKTVCDKMPALSTKKEWTEFQTAYAAVAESILGRMDYLNKSTVYHAV